jgi:CheY-specific phosphatase CheX
VAKTILILRPSKDMAAAAMTAVERFQKVSGMELTVYRQNINQAADAIEAGRIDVIFTATTMERSEANVFIGCLERSKSFPYIIASPDNAEKLQSAIPVDKLCKAKNDFSLEFIFACLRNLLTPSNYKLDARYFKSILTSVMEVVHRNTQLRLTPAQVSEVKAEESTETIAAVMTFYGDGIYGSLTLMTCDAVLKKFGETILFLPPEQVDRELGMDLLAEITNQIMGVMRSELRDFGWTLKTSLQLVHSGDHFLNKDTAPGTSFKLPFKLDNEKFDLVLRYNTYQVSVQEIEINMDNRMAHIMDVRLLNLAMDVCQGTFRTSFGVDARKQAIHAGHTKPHTTEAVYVFHAGGWQGEYTLVIEMDFATAQLLAKRVKKQGDESLEDSEGQIRVFSTMIQKMGQEFNRLSKQYGYSFEQVYSGAAFSDSAFHSLLRSPGYFIQIPFVIGASRIILSFGLRSDYAKTLFDAWPLVSTMPGFSQPEPAAS